MGGLCTLNDLSDSRIIPDHDFHHTSTKSVANKFHSAVGSNMLTGQSNIAVSAVMSLKVRLM